METFNSNLPIILWNILHITFARTLQNFACYLEMALWGMRTHDLLRISSWVRVKRYSDLLRWYLALLFLISLLYPDRLRCIRMCLAGLESYIWMVQWCIWMRLLWILFLDQDVLRDIQICFFGLQSSIRMCWETSGCGFSIFRCSFMYSDMSSLLT